MELSRLETVTPGDFAAVVRRVRILGFVPDAGTIVRELGEELRAKPGGGKPRVGFGGRP